LAGWKTLTGKEANSQTTASTVDSESDFQFEYNETAAAKTVTITGTKVDILGNSYSGSVILQPFTSLVVWDEN
jgi:hypothetical protein